MTTENILGTIIDLGDAVENGAIQPLQTYVDIKKVYELCGEIMEQIKPQAIDDAQKWGTKEIEIAGCVVTVKNAPGKWDYSGISQWNDLKSKIKGIEESAKSAYKNGMNIIDGNGEQVQPASYKEGGVTLSVQVK